MALHTKTQDQTPEPQPQQTQPQQTQPQQPQPNPYVDPNAGATPNPKPQVNRGNANINSDFRRTISRNTASENTLEFVEEVRELFKKTDSSANEDIKMSVTVLDKNVVNTPMSMVLLSLPTTNPYNGVIEIPYFIFIMESSDATLEKGNRHLATQYGQNGEKIQNVITASDYFGTNRDMAWQAERHIINYYGSEDAQYIRVGHMLVPSEIKPDEHQTQIRSMVFSANTCIENYINTVVRKDETPFNVEYIRNSNNNLHANINFSPGDQVYSMTGIPARTDVSITLRGEPVQQGGGHLPDMVASEPLTFVGGYMDLVYSKPHVAQQQWGPQFPNQQNPYDKITYLPRFIITRLDTEIDAITLELQLLGLVTSLMLVDTSNGYAPWMEAFKPKTDSGLDFHDIGAVGYEVDLMDDGVGRPVETKSSDFQNRKFALESLIQRVMHMNPLISMDVEESGDLSWINTVFFQASDPEHPNHVKAVNEIYVAANNLTNGHFEASGYQGPVCRSDNNRVHIGFYKNSQQHRDIRDIDYLAMLNVVGPEGDLDPLVKFSESYEPTQPLMWRLNKRFEEITKVIGYEPRVKDWARRINFDPTFLKTLLVSCQNAGLSIQNENTRLSYSAPRGHHGLENYAFDMMHSNVFVSNMHNPMGGDAYNQYGYMANGYVPYAGGGYR